MIVKPSKIIGSLLAVSLSVVFLLVVIAACAVTIAMQQDSTYTFIMAHAWHVLLWVVLLHCTLICAFLLYIEFLYTKSVEDEVEDEHEGNPVG